MAAVPQPIPVEYQNDSGESGARERTIGIAATSFAVTAAVLFLIYKFVL